MENFAKTSQVKTSEHLDVAMKMANDISSRSPEVANEMIFEILTTVRSRMNDRIAEAQMHLEYLQQNEPKF